jgi:hypothetical protein
VGSDVRSPSREPSRSKPESERLPARQLDRSDQAGSPLAVVRGNARERRLVTLASLPNLQRVIGNQAVTSLLARPNADRAVATATATSPRHIQRAMLDKNDQTFKTQVVEKRKQVKFKGKFPTTVLVQLVTAQVKVNEDVLATEDRLAALLNVQRSLEEWKFDQPEDQAQCADTWTALNAEVRAKIQQLSTEQTEAAKQDLRADQKLSAKSLAEAKRAELVSQAMRIIVGNVQQYRENSEGSKPRERLKRTDKGGAGAVPATVSPVTFAQTAKAVEERGVAICSHFAQAAANILVNNGVRVDVVAGAGGSTGSGHSYVLLGRANDDVFDIATWGDDCFVVDGWNGALNWDDFQKDPEVIYEKDFWATQFPVNQHSFDSQRGYKDKGNGLEADVKNEKPTGAMPTLVDAQTREYVKKQAAASYSASKERYEARQTEQKKPEATAEEEAEPLKTAANWKEAEKLTFGYENMVQIGSELFVIKGSWPRFNPNDRTALESLAKKVS